MVGESSKGLKDGRDKAGELCKFGERTGELIGETLDSESEPDSITNRTVNKVDLNKASI